jgi:hypothetical protein
MFVEQALLELILYDDDQDEDVVYSEIVTAFALKCRTLKVLILVRVMIHGRLSRRLSSVVAVLKSLL